MGCAGTLGQRVGRVEVGGEVGGGGGVRGGGAGGRVAAVEGR